MSTTVNSRAPIGRAVDELRPVTIHSWFAESAGSVLISMGIPRYGTTASVTSRELPLA